MQSPGPLLLVATAALLCLIWGTTWAAIRIGLAGIPPFTGVALRFGIASAVLFAYARAAGVRLGSGRRERVLWLVNGLFAFTISYGVVYWAEQWVPSGLSSVLFATYPLLVAIMSHFVLPGERLSWAAVTGIALGFGGVAVIFSADFALLGGRQVLIGSLVLLLSPLAAGAATVVVKRLGAGVHPLSLTAVPMGLTAVVMGALALAVECDRPVVFDAVSVSALVYLSLFGSAITFTLYYWLLSHVAATRVALIAYVIPIVAVFVGSVFLDEPLTPRILAGTALVVLGVALTVQLHGRRLARGVRGG